MLPPRPHNTSLSSGTFTNDGSSGDTCVVTVVVFPSNDGEVTLQYVLSSSSIVMLVGNVLIGFVGCVLLLAAFCETISTTMKKVYYTSKSLNHKVPKIVISVGRLPKMWFSAMSRALNRATRFVGCVGGCGCWDTFTLTSERYRICCVIVAMKRHYR